MSLYSGAYYGMLMANHPCSMRHYGVMGMRWGVRHDKANRYSIKNIKKDARSAKKTIKASRKSSLKSADSKQSVKEIKAVHKTAMKGIRKQRKTAIHESKVSTANRLYRMNSEAANRKVISEGRVKTAVKTMILGSYGALKYDQVRASGSGRAKTFIQMKYAKTTRSGRSDAAKIEYMTNVAMRENVNSVLKEQKRTRKVARYESA